MLIQKKTIMKKFLRRIIIDKTDNTFVQLFRYTFVGGIAFVIDFTLLYLLTDYVGLYHIISASISFIVGLAVNYVLSKIFVFSHSVVQNKTGEFLIFALIGVVGLFLTDLMMWILVDMGSIYYLTAKIITTLLVYLWNFFARKYILFNYRGDHI